MKTKLMRLLFPKVVSVFGVASLVGGALAQTTTNGNARFFSVDPFAQPAGSSNYVSSYTGTLANGATWTLTGVDNAPSDGKPGGLINPYNALADGYGNTVNTVANNVGPWQNPLVVRDGTGSLDGTSAYFAWGGWGTSGGVDYIGQSAQTYESPVLYTMTFSVPQTEFYMYVREIDDGQMSQWSATPSVLKTSSTLRASIVYDSLNNIVRDGDNIGEGLDINSPGIPYWDYILGNWTNPSAAGVLKFSDPNGITSLSWVTELNPNGAQSDGFQIAFATPVPEPASFALLGLAGALGLVRRRR